MAIPTDKGAVAADNPGDEILYTYSIARTQFLALIALARNSSPEIDGRFIHT